MIKSAVISLCIIISLSEASGQISFREDARVRSLMDTYARKGKEDTHVNGWRIKLVSTTDRRRLDRTRDQFVFLYPGLKFSTSYENPYYSLKVGAFETRYDLESLLVKFKEDFREAIPFRDKILKSELFDIE